MEKILIQSFRIFISVLFVFSAISKMLSLPFFDGLVAELFLGENYYDYPQGFYLIQFFTPVIIAGEFLLAVAILHDFLLKSVVGHIPSLFLLLLT